MALGVPSLLSGKPDTNLLGLVFGTVVAGLQQLFFLLNDDSRCDHHHQALRFTTDTNILEQSVDVRNVVEDWQTTLITAFP